jgi:mono/diheme cytochrome c family protein
MSVAGEMKLSLFALAVTLCSAETASAQLSPDARRGLTFIRVHCAQCHAIDKVSDSLLTIAPPFRDLHLKFPIETLRRRLSEGISAAHPTMPTSGWTRTRSRTSSLI